MSLDTGFNYEYSDINLKGVSIAGVGTCLFLPQISTCFDVAQGLPFAYHAKNFLITHCHMDHAGGIPYILSQRGLMGLPKAKFYMPENMIDPMQKIIKTWEGMEGHDYSYEFISIKPGDEFSLLPEISVRAFATAHRVQSQGYCIYKSKKRLKPEYRGLSREQILALKSQGSQVNERVSKPWVAFTGDTKIDFLDLSPEVKKAKLLIMEVTYWDSKKSVEDSRDWGHIHLDELIPRLGELENERVLLTHISRRHRAVEIKKILNKRIPSEIAHKIAVFPTTGPSLHGTQRS